MFVPVEHAVWPEPGAVAALRVSLNAPVLVDGARTVATRAALGFWPDAHSGAVLRLWLRSEPAADRPGNGGAAVSAYEHAARPPGPAARQSALEHAERFLAGMGFLFEEACDAAWDETCDAPWPLEAASAALPGAAAPAASAPADRVHRTGSPGPAVARADAGPPDPALAAWLRALGQDRSTEGTPQ